MAENTQQTELLQAYLQADAPSRAPRFADMVQILRGLPEDEALAWARRTVSPQLDYSSLMKLRRFLQPRGTAAHRRRLAVLGGPTTIQLRQLIEVFLEGEGIDAEIYEAEYGLFRQEILTPGSGLDRFQPEIILVATGARDLARLPSLDMDESAVARLASEELGDWERLWNTAQSKWNATVLQNNFEIGPGTILGHHSLRHAAARENYLDRLNRLFAERAPAHVVLHDLRGLAAEAGARHWFDPRFYLEFKMPCGPECLVAYAHSVVCLVRAVLGRSKKVLVLDLDNTLWGGVVGDLGPGGIRVGQGSGEGEAFVAFQKFAKELKQRGVVLAVCSKNDEDKALEPFEKREDMILQREDFACFVANWKNKADNLRTIAGRLDLKLDSFVFADDNPAERALVRRLLPEVAVPDMPEDPAGYIHAVASQRYFETVAFTREDAERARFYADNARRQELALRSTDVGSFLASLDMRMKIARINDMNVERVAQLINKSNQFNLTTRRYTLAQVRDLAGSSEWRTLTFSLKDNLGDNGLISVILLQKQGEALAIDTWVMSCRVLQRGVEQFARNELIELARSEACAEIVGTYIPTSKNALVERHYAGLGFEPIRSRVRENAGNPRGSDDSHPRSHERGYGAEGEHTLWSLRVDGTPPLSHFIQRESADA